MNNNLFEGKSSKAKFARILYSFVKKGKWFSLTAVMEEYIAKENKTKENRRGGFSVTNNDKYGELKKAVLHLGQELELKYSGCWEKRGNNRTREYKYNGEDPDPLKDMMTASVIGDLRTYWEFCQDSAGFFPTSWLNYFFEGTKDLFEIERTKSKGQQCIYSSIDRELTNIGLLPILYECVKEKKVIRFNYRQGYKEVVPVVFHPHVIREYNGRWHIYGNSKDLEERLGCSVVALDRIEGVPVKLDVKYEERPKGFYEEKFKYLVGSTFAEHKKIVFRAYGEYMWGLFKSKPMPNYRIVNDYDKELGYGDFEADVTINNELFGRVLQFSPGLQILSAEDDSVLDKLKERIRKTAEMYGII
ncbi:MAG: WYL domain-containing protein [Paludibacteraceae bacterium]|nr:WYL domain-containing protein [Paludibacteraceae bacterium]